MKVWYVSYGSNMNYSRFSTYILGGKVTGSNKVEIGCSDKTLPIRKELFKHNRELRFLNQSKRWDGGVLFLGEPGNNDNYAVRYLVEDEQFIDILKQENNKLLDVTINISVSDLQNNVTKAVFPNSWYSTLLYLGEYDGYKAYTFTCDKEMFTRSPVTPTTRYLKVILHGISSFDSKEKSTAVNTFLKVPGVFDSYTFYQLEQLLD